MIRYALHCDHKHDFEIWFQDSADYDKQSRRGLVTCPFCDSNKIDKSIMAPRLAGTRKGRKAPPEPMPSAPEVAAPAPEANPVAMMMSPQEAEFRAKLKELREHIVKNADNVGKKFPEEARKMHYGEIDHRSIYGEATPEDAEALAEEGIEFHPIPILPEDRN
jgi:hypothetical protein